MHWIQRHIVNLLMRHETLRFSDLRADGVESNLFQYHLRHVIRKKLVEKTDTGYQLAPKGLYYADRYSSELKGERPQPKIITIAVVKNSQGQVLLQQKQRQPWLGDYHLPAGKIHTGEGTSSAATRELYEKTGIALNSDMKFRTVAHVRILRAGELISDYFGFVFLGTYDGPAHNGVWYCSGMDIKLAPSVAELLNLEQQGDEQFHSIVVNL